MRPVRQVEVRQAAAFSMWFKALADKKASDRIAVRIRRLELGNPGEVKPVGDGISEMKIDYGPGYKSLFHETWDQCRHSPLRRRQVITSPRHQAGEAIGKGALTVALETSAWDIQDHITTKERQLGYLQAALEDGDPGVVAAALGDIAKARGMAIVAKSTNVTREGLYKALSPKGDPRLSTLLEVTKALGLRLNVSRAVQVKRESIRKTKPTEKVAASPSATSRRRSA